MHHLALLNLASMSIIIKAILCSIQYCVPFQVHRIHVVCEHADISMRLKTYN
ncbi:hypothetical protein Hanom_Chr17g01559931 [Helianthus anomalus]